MYEDRLLQNYLETDTKLKLSGRRAAPVKNDQRDIRIAYHREQLLENLQLSRGPRSDEILKRLYHLGKAAGNK
uniref:Uncharacterized protein n=1 Tax=Panagrolaimus sp. ES5 TaxID=591445 RepID=A0AC34F909_9BILA